MSHPLEDGGFTLWHGDLDTQLKRSHGVTSKDLGVSRRTLQDKYYAGTSVFTAVDALARQHSLS
jgi:hypothetical protein